MRKALLIIGVIATFSTASIAQTKIDTIKQLQNRTLKLEILNSKLTTQINSANTNIKKLENKLSAAVDSMDILKEELRLSNNNLLEITRNLELQIRQLSNKTDAELSTINKTVSRNTLYWILALISVMILTVILFGWLKNKLAIGDKGLSDQIKNRSEALQGEVTKLDNKLFWLLDSKMNLTKTEQQNPDEIDHTLSLKVADEILRIQKNLRNMDPATKGVEQIASAVDRIQDNFRENGYEMVEMLNKPYDKGMNVSAKFKPDETLEHGEQIITRIIKPQVNYRGVIVQTAQVEVSIGE